MPKWQFSTKEMNISMLMEQVGRLTWQSKFWHSCRVWCDRYIQLGKKGWYAVSAKTVVICLLEEFLIRKLLSLAVDSRM